MNNSFIGSLLMILFMLSVNNNAFSDSNKTIYDFSAKTITGEIKRFSDYRGKVLLIVNTASRCGFTNQFASLEILYQKYKDRGFEILGFPSNQFANQEPLSNKEILNFCTLNYNVTFQMFEKIDVNGKNAHPLYVFLKEKKGGFFGKDIKWNFTKFLIDRKGNVIKRYPPSYDPLKIQKDIEMLINQK